MHNLYDTINNKKHIIWDWNGTLLNDIDHAVQIVNTLLTEHELPNIDRNQCRQVFNFPVLNYCRGLKISKHYLAEQLGTFELHIKKAV